jgi:biotin synthase
MIAESVTTPPTPTATPPWEGLADKALAGECLTRAEALSVLEADDDELLALLNAAFRVRRHYFGRKVKLNMLLNAQSGRCLEDCGYCSQSFKAKTEIDEYCMVSRETIVAGAKRAAEVGAGTYCIVCSGRSPTNRDVEKIATAVEEIKESTSLKVCACLGILLEGQADRLKAAGVDRYNHNINTSASHHAEVTTTHSYDDRVRTVNRAKAAGISPCSGVIIGMGESHDDILETAFALREIGADSIPVNFLHPVDGTPLGDRPGPNPRFCLKALALFRFLCPDKEIRASGGREVNLRSLQGMALYAANAMFIGDYLTTDGQEPEDDHQLIADMGFEIDN